MCMCVCRVLHYAPMMRELAMRLVATSLMVLCEAPEDLMVAARHALGVCVCVCVCVWHKRGGEMRGVEKWNKVSGTYLRASV